jgi:hypothetical protein
MESPSSICGLIIRAMLKRSATPLILGIAGLAMIGTALLAQELGLDPNPGWGRGRVGLLILGACIVLTAGLYRRYQAEVSKWISRRWSLLRDLPVIKDIRQNGALLYLSGLLRTNWFVIPILMLVLLIYVWFVSAGTWTTWISPTHLYADLPGLSRGNLHVAMKVPEHLLTGADPFTLHGHLGYLDRLFFKGSTTLVGPGASSAPGHAPSHHLLETGRSAGADGLLAGLLIAVPLLVVIWDRFFRHLPKYKLVLAVLVVGLTNPATYILDYTRAARIYEAAIVGGQLFLLGGFLAAVTALGPPLRPLRLAVAGTLWALAAGTRATLVVPVGLMALMAAWWSGCDQRWSEAYRT